MLKVLKKMFDNEYKELKRFTAIADAIDSLDEDMQKLTDDELKEYTNKFKERLENGESLEDILVEAFAVAREEDVVMWSALSNSMRPGSTREKYTPPSGLEKERPSRPLPPLCDLVTTTKGGSVPSERSFFA